MTRVQLHRFVDLAKKPASRAPANFDRRGISRRRGGTGGDHRDGAGSLRAQFRSRRRAAALSRSRHRRASTSASNTSSATRRSSGCTPARMWAEGPAWSAVGRYLLWSDIPNDENLRYLEEDDHVSRRFRYPAGNSNGNTFDYEGRQIACQHGTRKVVRYEHNGKTTVLADKFENQEFNAPNDAVVHPNDGSIWFTDPGYGSLMEYEGNRLPQSAHNAAAAAQGGDLPHRQERARSPRSPTSRSSRTASASATTIASSTSPTPASRTTRRRRARSGSTTSTGTTLKNPKTFVSMEMERQDRLRRRHPLRRGRQRLVERRLGRRRL